VFPTSETDSDLLSCFFDENKENIDPLARLRVPLSKKKSQSTHLRKHKKLGSHKRRNQENLMLEPLRAIVSELTNSNSQNLVHRRSIVMHDSNRVRTPFAELPTRFKRMI
jgi:hypothetical protein